MTCKSCQCLTRAFAFSALFLSPDLTFTSPLSPSLLKFSFLSVTVAFELPSFTGPNPCVAPDKAFDLSTRDCVKAAFESVMPLMSERSCVCACSSAFFTSNLIVAIQELCMTSVPQGKLQCGWFSKIRQQLKVESQMQIAQDRCIYPPGRNGARPQPARITHSYATKDLPTATHLVFNKDFALLPRAPLLPGP